jgi:hypothetical protein
VPAVLVSPWVKPGVDHTQFDHTSVLKYLTEKWGLGPLGRRTAAATSIGKLITGSPMESGPTRISLSAPQLQPPDPRAEEEAFGASSSHQAALAQLAQWLEIEAVEKAPRIAVLLAKIAEATKAFAERYILGPDGGFSVSVAQPDKLSLPLQTSATDSIASFMMRMKRYAAMGLRTRLEAADLAADQQQHSLQTLALISGRNFHLEDDAEKIDNAKAWLSKGVGNPQTKVVTSGGAAPPK